MSRHMNAPFLEQILHDARHLHPDELGELYGIELDDEGHIFDPITNSYFTTISEWASSQAEYEAMDVDESYGHGKQTHGDWY